MILHQINSILKEITLIMFIGLLSSCSKSLVYSPSINLTNQPIKEKQIDLQGAFELLPEARPEELGGSPITAGVSGQISYGFTERFNLTLKGWGDISSREPSIRTGYSLTGQFIKLYSEQNRLIILPRIGMALSGSDIAGYGLGLSTIYQSNINEKLSWYAGGGLIWGFRYLSKDFNRANEIKLPMGIGIMGNLGIGWQISKNFRLNCELNPIYQINTFDRNSQFLLSPSIGIGYTLNRKSG